MNDDPVIRLPTPDTFWRRFVRQPYGYEAGIAFFSSFAGPATACVFWQRGAIWPAVLIFIGTAGVVVFAIAKTWVLFREQRREESMHDLEGALETLIWALRSTHDDQDDPGLRAAVFAHSTVGGGLVQLMSYVGDNRAGFTKGRLLGVATGTIGMAYRLNESIIGKRSSDEYQDYLDELVTFWGFTRHEALQRDPNAMSWWAVPLEILDARMDEAAEQRLRANEDIPPSGILYLDSTDRSFFDDNLRTEIVEYASLGIAKFCGRRYSDKTVRRENDVGR